MIHVEKPREELELLALRLYVHGQTGVSLPVTRRLARTPLWLELRCLLREYFTEAEVAYLMNRHPKGCACWGCVMALHRAVRRHRDKLNLSSGA